MKKLFLLTSCLIAGLASISGQTNPEPKKNDLVAAAAEIKQPVLDIVNIKLLPGKQAELFALFDSPEGLPLTRKWQGNRSAERAYDAASNTVTVVRSWDSLADQESYRNFRVNIEQPSTLAKLVALAEPDGLKVSVFGSDYKSY